jgi:hypothetical protein
MRAACAPLRSRFGFEISSARRDGGSRRNLRARPPAGSARTAGQCRPLALPETVATVDYGKPPACDKPARRAHQRGRDAIKAPSRPNQISRREAVPRSRVKFSTQSTLDKSLASNWIGLGSTLPEVTLQRTWPKLATTSANDPTRDIRKLNC